MSVTDDYTITRGRYDEQVVAGHRLGRHVLIDSRSAAYPFAVVKAVPVVSVEHKRSIPILNQGDLGSCEGNAETGAVGTAPVVDALPASHAVLDEQEAVALYSAATKLDGYPGTYPPTDTGTDNTSVMKAARNAGLISGWTNASSVDAVLQALMSGPVVLGIDWYDSFDQPDPNGLVTISANATVRGGHAIVCRRVDADKRLIGPDNSWGPSWAVKGSFWLSWADLGTLLGGNGEATVPVPLSSPAPVPVPVPPPSPADPVLAQYLGNARLQQWARKRHTGDNAYAAQQYANLLSAEK